MLAHNAVLEQNEYRLVLVRFGSQAIWVKRADGALRLPRVTIPRWTRPAEQLQLVIEAGWHLRTIILDVLPSKIDSAPCAVVEIMSSEAPNGLAAAKIDEIAAEEMTGEEREAIKAILAGNMSTRAPFSRIGWIQEAMKWVGAEIGHDIQFTADIHQYNAGAGFALVRFAAETGPAYWLKATGEPNVHEFHITRKLAKLCPEYLPRHIAAREDWNAWVMEDAGLALDTWTLPALERAVVSMAMVQKETIGQTWGFLAAGASDQRICVLRAHLTEVVEYLDDAMTRQTSTKVPRIEKRRLWRMASILQDACFHMEALGIPDTLVHNDINSGNILFNGPHCVFTDWCEVGVGNPFLAFHYLCLLQPRCEENWMTKLQDAYGRCWSDSLSTVQIELAFALTPLLAVLCYLYGRGTWLRSSERNDPHVESHARSLARHMDRATQDSRLLEALCH